MREVDHLNILAVLADTEARSTAAMVELIAASALYKLTPPEGDAVVELTITQGDLLEAAKDYYWRTSYDDAGTMTLRLSRNKTSLFPDAD